MHRSRLSTFLTDSPQADADASVRFWSAALGTEAVRGKDAPEFNSLRTVHPDLTVAVQSVVDAPRVHVDIETDDVAAECARLTELGAVQIHVWLECHTLRVPGGHLVYVIPLHSDLEIFDRLARVWP